jgi:hypothetical protein
MAMGPSTMWASCGGEVVSRGLTMVRDIGRHSVSTELSYYVMPANGVMVERRTEKSMLELTSNQAVAVVE